MCEGMGLCPLLCFSREVSGFASCGVSCVQERHEEALTALRAAMQEAEAARVAAQEALAAKEQQLAEAGEAAAKLRKRITEMESAEGAGYCLHR